MYRPGGRNICHTEAIKVNFAIFVFDFQCSNKVRRKDTMKKKFGRNLVSKYIRVKCFFSENNFFPKKFLGQNIFFPKKIVGQNVFFPKKQMASKFCFLKKIWVNICFPKKNLGRNLFFIGMDHLVWLIYKVAY